MLYRAFARVVSTAAIFLAAVFVIPAAHAGATDSSGFTTTPLAQPETIDVQLDPVITPGRVIDLTPAPQPVATADPAQSNIQTSPLNTVAVSFAMATAGLALICIPLAAEAGPPGRQTVPA